MADDGVGGGVRGGFDPAEERRFWVDLERLVAGAEVVIDRPRGQAHPRWGGAVFPFDYGYLDGTAGGDGAGVDVWLGPDPDRVVVGVFAAVDSFKRDAELKIVLGCSGADVEAIRAYYRKQGQAVRWVARRARPGGAAEWALGSPERESTAERLVADPLVAHLREQLNGLLRRPGLYIAHRAYSSGARLYLDALEVAADAAGLPPRWGVIGWLKKHGAYGSTMAHGVLLTTFGEDAPVDHYEMAVFADYARYRGWLDLDRALDPAEYRDLREAIPEWIGSDRSLAETLDRFGPPSLRSGGGWGECVLAYATDGDEPMVQLFFAGCEPRHGDERELLGVRVAQGPVFEVQLTSAGRAAVGR